MAKSSPTTRIPSPVVTRTTEHPDVASRRRQSKKDEAIRKKLESELSKKKTGASHIQQKRQKQVPGTVSALRPLQALTVPEKMLVMEAAQLMAAKRTDCVLVVNEDGHLSGIFTSKDFAYRVVAESLDPRSTTVAQIMTKDPMCVTSDTSATDALNLMVARGFRHLPVCDDSGDIFGLLDITKCLYEALDKMERAYTSSRKLYDALEGMEREWTSHSPVHLGQYMDALREGMSCPDLFSVLDGARPAQVSVRTSVREVARMMKEYHTTAVLVADKHGLAGIFTTKDVVLRVIAPGLNPETSSVVRVMTPHPDTATPQTTILEALRRMHDGHYLNIPVLEDGVIIGMVDVLKLTYATLEQIHSIQGGDNEGPLWSRFWESFGAGDNESQSSDPSTHHQPPSLNAKHPSTYSTTPPEIMPSPEMTPEQSERMEVHSPDPLPTTTTAQRQQHRIDDIPNDPSPTPPSSRHLTDPNLFAFKFTSPSGKTHRFMSPQTSYAALYDTIKDKLNGEVESQTILAIHYVDDDNDEVLISTDTDILGAVQLAESLGQNRVILHVQVVPTAPKPSARNMASSRAAAAAQKTRKSHSEPERFILRQDMMLPAAITFLGAVIIGVVAFSKVNTNSSRT